jgi:hypothetical protein
MKIIFLCFAILFLSSCSHVSSESKDKSINQVPTETERSKDYSEPNQVATLNEKSIDESSGVVASKTNSGIFWTNNDSGNPPLIYAFDAQGKHRGVWRVMGAENVDWEDMAIAYDSMAKKNFLYIGDIGDNDRKRESIIVYRVTEPTVKPEDARAKKSDPLQTEDTEAIRLQYPDGKHNAETLLVHPTTNDIYIVTKTEKGVAAVYKISSPSLTSINKLVKVSDVSVPSLMKGLLTGGAISPDGRRVILCDYFAAFEFVLNSNGKFDDIWKEKPLAVNLGQRQQGEAVCYSADGKTIYATSEKTPTPLIEVKRVK